MNNLTCLKPGTVLRVPKGIVMHEGIYVGNDSVVHASKKRGRVVKESLAQFANGKNISVKGYPGKLPPESVSARASSKIGERYSLLSDNCEHLTNFAHGLGKKSPQLQFGVALAVIGFLATR